MDTNTLQAAPDNTLLIVGMIIAAVAPTLASLGAYLKAKSAMDNTHESRKLAEATASEVAKVHIAVNSGATAMADKLEKATAEILRITGEMAGLQEQKRGHEMKAAEVAAVAASKTPHFEKMTTEVASTKRPVGDALQQTIESSIETVAAAKTTAAAAAVPIEKPKDIV